MASLRAHLSDAYIFDGAFPSPVNEVKAIIMKCHSNKNENIPSHVQICNFINYMRTLSWIIHNNHFIHWKPKTLKLVNYLQNLVQISLFHLSSHKAFTWVIYRFLYGD